MIASINLWNFPYNSPVDETPPPSFFVITRAVALFTCDVIVQYHVIKQTRRRRLFDYFLAKEKALTRYMVSKER